MDTYVAKVKFQDYCEENEFMYKGKLFKNVYNIAQLSFKRLQKLFIR